MNCDALVVGGGPAGLTAAIYLARFHLEALVIDAGRGRCASIPRTHNHAGYPHGVVGAELVADMAAQARRWGARVEAGTVVSLKRDGEGFVADTSLGTVHARAVILATGVVNHRPPGMDDALHDEALRQGALRYCPVCDGFEVTDKRVGVIGTGSRGAGEALFLRSYTADVTLVAPEGDHILDDEQRARLADAGVPVLDGPVGGYALEDGLAFDAGARRVRFDSVYPALGSRIRSELAGGVGAGLGDAGCLLVDDHQRTDVPGVYAAGDVVLGLDQISHAMGEGGVAAATLRNDLAERAPMRREPMPHRGREEMAA